MVCRRAVSTSVALSQELRAVRTQLGQELVEVGRKAIEMVGQQAARRADLRGHRTPRAMPCSARSIPRWLAYPRSQSPRLMA